MLVEPIRSKKEIDKIANYLKDQNYRDYMIFKFGINFGLRISDILKLNVCDVKNKKIINIIERKTKKKEKLQLIHICIN